MMWMRFSVVVMVLSLVLPWAEAVNCDRWELFPCVPAVLDPEPPSEACCIKLREQRDCLCGYIKDIIPPEMSKTFLENPKPREIAKTCGGIPYPHDCIPNPN
ncbi:hypothetical protein REPUB_Repub13aG0130300 [Reevesia pubescens]